MMHLLFLDDEVSQIDLMQRYYQRCPLSKITKAEFFESPLGAINEVKKGGIDVVILDIKLGNISGYDVISNIARQSKKPKIIAYTGYQKETDVRNRFIDQYILKSRGLNYLFSKLEELALKDRHILCDLTASA